jgi:hypothetical protein
MQHYITDIRLKQKPPFKEGRFKLWLQKSLPSIGMKSRLVLHGLMGWRLREEGRS